MNLLSAGSQDPVARALVLAIRQAGAMRDLSALDALTEGVRHLVLQQRQTRDPAMAATLPRLMAELRSAANGTRPPYPVMEHKDCAGGLSLRPLSGKRAAGTDDGPVVQGYASVFGGVDLVGDTVRPGAFSRSLAAWRASGRPPAMLFSHDTQLVCGRWFHLAEDKRGLFVAGTLAATSLGSDLTALIRQKALDGLSIGFQISDDDGAVYQSDGRRELRTINLWEISICALPCDLEARLTQGTATSNGARRVEDVRSRVDSSYAQASDRLDNALATLRQSLDRYGENVANAFE